MSAESNGGNPIVPEGELLQQQVSSKFFSIDEAEEAVDELLKDEGSVFGVKDLFRKLGLTEKIKSFLVGSQDKGEEEVAKLTDELTQAANSDIYIFIEDLVSRKLIEKVGSTISKLSARYRIVSNENSAEVTPEQEALNRLNRQLAALRRELEKGLEIRSLAVSMDTSIDSTFGAELLRWFGEELLKNESLSGEKLEVVQYADSKVFSTDTGETGFLGGLRKQGPKVLPIGLGGGKERNQPLDEHSFIGPRRSDLSAGRLVAALLRIVKPTGDLDVGLAKETLKEIPGFSEQGVERLIGLIRYCVDDDTRGRDVFGGILDEDIAFERHRFFLGRFVGQMWRYCKFDEENGEDAYRWAATPLRSYFAAAVQGDYDFSNPRPELLKRAVEEWKNRAGNSYSERDFAAIEGYANHRLNVEPSLERNINLINELRTIEGGVGLSEAQKKRLDDLLKKNVDLESRVKVSPFELASVVALVAETEGDEKAIEWAQQAINAIYEQGKMRSAAKERLDEAGIKGSKEIKIIDEKHLPLICGYREVDKEFNNEIGWAFKKGAEARVRKGVEYADAQIFIEQRKPDGGDEQGNARVLFYGNFQMSTLEFVSAAIGRAELRAATDRATLNATERKDFFKEGSMPGDADRWYVYFTHQGPNGEKNGVWLLNGSLKHPTVPATRLTIDQIIAAVKIGVEEHTAAMIKAEKSGNKSKQSKDL